ncbi:MAG: winged helix-turn-helix domain-containing protein [Xanthomonadales bacterium]|nr:winged helix-turn-helix domain-containing protein [Xanthomonadales bacterium]
MSAYRFEQLRFTADDGLLLNERDGRTETLRPQAATLLRYLLDHPGTIIPRDQLFETVWGPDVVVDFESGLAALLRELRQAIKSLGGREDLIETVPRRGYRFNAEVNGPADEQAPTRRRPWPMILSGLLLVLLVGLGFVYLFLPKGEPDSGDREYSLAILPFEAYQPVAAMPEHVGLLMADTLLAELLRRPMEGLDLIGRTSLRPYVDREDVVAAVAANLGVDLLIEGLVSGLDNGGWQAELRLLAVPSGQVVWSTVAEGESSAPMDVRSVAGRLADDLAEAWPTVRGDLHSRDSGR